MPTSYSYRLRLEVIATCPSHFNKVVEVDRDLSGTLDDGSPGRHLRQVVEEMLSEVKREQTGNEALGKKLATGTARRARF